MTIYFNWTYPAFKITADKLPSNNQNYKKYHVSGFMETTEKEEINNVIRSIDVSKSSMVTNINIHLLKVCLICAIDHVCCLFNLILKSGIFPDE